MTEVARTGARRGSTFRSWLHRSVGAGFIIGACVLILLGPVLMSRSTLAAAQMFTVIAGGAFGVYLAANSRSTQVSVERAYSAHLEELSQRLRNMAYRDAVTGLYNHRYFREQLQHEVERATRYGAPLSLILMDMNKFKEINDRYGHFMGDRFLGLVGEIIQRHVRSSDVGARYGGDEFVVILPNTTLEEARATADKLGAAVAGSAAMTASGETVELGVSCGVASCPSEARTPSELIERADGRLYEVKAARKAEQPRVA